ncbi:MFS transporter [Photobacterium aquimaris]|uniref:MFS transporter n=2 Tax=Vibrionaceae TaxID=641 RepID=A0A2T3IHR7_9GAMM|nr:MFS transporter [Photobacterium aquimaris]
MSHIYYIYYVKSRKLTQQRPRINKFFLYMEGLMTRITENHLKYTSYNGVLFSLGLFSIGTAFLMSILPFTFKHFGFDKSFVRDLTSIYYLGVLLGVFVTKPIINKLQYKWGILFFICLYLITVTILASYPYISIWLACRFFAGIAVAGIYISCESWLLLVTPKSQQAARLATNTAVLCIGRALGQTGISITGTEGYTPFIAISIMILCSLLPLMVMCKTAPIITKATKINLEIIGKINIQGLFGCLASGLILGSLYGLMPLELHNCGYDQHKTSYFMVSIIIGGILAKPIAKVIQTKLTKPQSIIVFSAVGIAAMLGFQFTENTIILFICSTLFGSAIFALYPIAIAQSTQSLNDELLFANAQIMFFAFSIGAVLSPLFAHPFMSVPHGLLDYFIMIFAAISAYLLIHKAPPEPKVQLA